MNREGLVDKVWHILFTKQNSQNLELLKVWSCWQRHKVNYWIYATSESDKQYISDLDKWKELVSWDHVDYIQVKQYDDRSSGYTLDGV